MIPLMTPKFLSIACTSSLEFLLEISTWLPSVYHRLYMSQTSNSDSHPTSNLKPVLSTYFPVSVNGNIFLPLQRPNSLELFLALPFLSYSRFDPTSILFFLSICILTTSYHPHCFHIGLSHHLL